MIGAIASAGALGHAYFERFVTQDELRTRALLRDAEIDSLRREVNRLSDTSTQHATDISSIRGDVSATREDVRTLLTHMLANPPTRGGKTP